MFVFAGSKKPVRTKPGRKSSNISYVYHFLKQVARNRCAPSRAAHVVRARAGDEVRAVEGLVPVPTMAVVII